MATGALNSKGIWIYGEDDSETTFSALLNKLGSSIAPQVKQVVNAFTATTATNTTTTPADTGLTATITPSSTTSKILVIVNQNGCYKSGDYGGQISLLRNTTVLGYLDNFIGFTNNTNINKIGSVSGTLFDNPATTSAITYKTQFNNTITGSGSLTRVQDGSALSTITLVEIAF